MVPVSQASIKRHRDEVTAKLFAFLEQERPQEIESIQTDTNLFEVGIMDSLLVVSLVVFIEQEFLCSLDFEDLTEQNLGSVSAMVDLVLRQGP